ncbi:MAG: class I SAM-dependent methyltransferase [Acidobacteriota bacterium]|nr:class I SAM-dependent methyltransferase [Acidobacteriota bacterium]
MTFACPMCRTTLTASDGGYQCSGCQRRWETKNGVPVLSPDPVLYPKEYVTPEQFDAWLADIETHGWDEAGRWLREAMESRGQKWRSVVSLSFDRTRADFHHLVPVEPHHAVLDYGCGLGSILFGLQPHAAQVVGIDQSLYRARLINTRAKAIGASNVMGICAGNSPHLPFPDASFDLVVMNGVLEWTPRAQEGKPSDVHARVLREVARVLKPGGALYLAIENRYGYRYLWGRRDSHNAGKKLPYVTVLPRALADLYTRAASRVPYRTWLHSYGGLRRLLGRTGFPNTSFFFPYPTYNQYRSFIPIDQSAAAAKAIDLILSHDQLPRPERLALTTLRGTGLAAHLAQDFAVVARKAE